MPNTGKPERAVAMQGAQHEAVAAECADDLGLFRHCIAVAFMQHTQCLLGIWRIAGNESDFSLGGKIHR